MTNKRKPRYSMDTNEQIKEEMVIIPVVEKKTREVVVINCKALKIREKPNKESKVRYLAGAGVVLIVKKDLGEWSQVEFASNKQQTGYAMNAYLEKKDD